MATRQIIKTGSTVDDGTGDLLRDAFTKVNTNFENVWDKTSVNSNLDFTGDTVTSTGELILSPASDIKTTTNVIFNNNKGNFDFTVHGDTSDNVLFIDASTNRVGILNNAPTVALDVTGDVAVSNALTVAGTTTLNGNITLGNASSDLVSYTARVGTNIEPYGSVTLGSTTNRWNNGFFNNIDVTGSISGTFSGSLDPSTTVTNNINSTTIIGDTITATTSAEVGNLLVTGTLAVQGATTTIDSATIQILDKLTFEGATANDFETSIVATDPTADRTINLPDASGNIAVFTTAPVGAIADGTNGQALTTNGSGVLSFTTVSGGGGIALTDLSVTVAAAGSSNLAYNSGTGAFTFTPPDLSTYLTSEADTLATIMARGNDGPAGVQMNLTSAFGSTTAGTNNFFAKSTTQVGASLLLTQELTGNYSLGDKTGNIYFKGKKTGNTDIQTGLISSEVTAWDGSDITGAKLNFWTSKTGSPVLAGHFSEDGDLTVSGTITGYQTTAGLNGAIDTHLNQSNPTSGYVLSWNGSDYAWVANSGSGLSNVVDDTTPQLGGTLDANGNTIDMGTNVLTDTNLGQFITAHGWGNHSGAGYITASSTDTLTNKSITKAQITDLTTGDLDMGGNKVLFGNVYSAEVDLPNATTYHGMFAHVHATGKGYFAHGGNWIALQNESTLNTGIDTHLNQSNPTSGYVLSWNGSDYAWVANTGSGATSINTAGNTGTGSVTFASETLTVTGTTNQINVDAASFALSLSLDADLTGLTTINTHTIPSGTGTIALTSDITAESFTSLAQDTTPQLGGDLDVNGKTIAHTFTLGANGSSDYTFSDAGNIWFPTTENDPVLYLRRGEQYIFVNSSGGSHPFEIRVSNGGSAYSTGVTNNGASSGNIVFKVPMSAPATLYYQCTNHSGMGNTINIV